MPEPFSPFFPNPWFAWVFYVALMVLLIVAAYFDLRYFAIPKPLSIITLLLGVAANIARGLWLGIEAGDWLYYGLGNALFVSITGFATGFGIFFVMWILGLAGGGDVKLFAAVATWIGYYYGFWLWIGSVVALVLLASVRLVFHTLTRGTAATRHAFSAKDASSGQKKPTSKPRQRLLAYSLSLTIAAALMLPWFFRVELGLEQPRQASVPVIAPTQP
jgi:Flp pilus assembly protein protease CpaA